jgi:hypothetical protein
MVIMMSVLIEEAAKALFFRDMVDGEIDQRYYSVWEIEGEFSNEDSIRRVYMAKAKKHLAQIGAV